LSFGNRNSLPYKTLNPYNPRTCLWSFTKTIQNPLVEKFWTLLVGMFRLTLRIQRTCQVHKMILSHIVSSIANKKSFPHKTLNSYNLRICLWSCTKTIHNPLVAKFWISSVGECKESLPTETIKQRLISLPCRDERMEGGENHEFNDRNPENGKKVCKKGTRREAGLWCLHKSEKAYIVFEGGTDAHTAHNSLRELHGQCR
jgi:hypothetical protein